MQRLCLVIIINFKLINGTAEDRGCAYVWFYLSQFNILTIHHVLSGMLVGQMEMLQEGACPHS